MVADAGEDVEQLALRGNGVSGRVGCDDADAEPAGALDQRLVLRFFLAMVVALDLGVETMAAEDIEQALIGVAGEADQPVREFGKFRGRGRPFALGRAQLHAGDQAAEVLVSGARFHQQRVSASVGAGDLAADVGAEAGLLRRHVEADGAVDAVTVHNRHGRLVELRAARGEFLGDG